MMPVELCEEAEQALSAADSNKDGNTPVGQQVVHIQTAKAICYELAALRMANSELCNAIRKLTPLKVS